VQLNSIEVVLSLEDIYRGVYWYLGKSKVILKT
jgi:hypothetical protein